MSPLQSVDEISRQVPAPIAWGVTLGSMAWSWLITFAAQWFPLLAEIDLAAAISALVAAGLSAVGGYILIRKAIDNYHVERTKKQHEVELGLARDKHAAELQMRREQEEAYRDSFAEQVDDLKSLAQRNEESLAQARKSLHEARNEAQERETQAQLEIERLRQEVVDRDERHNAEAQRLMRQIEMLSNLTREARTEQTDIHATAEEIDQTTKRIDQKTDRFSGDDIPAQQP